MFKLPSKGNHLVNEYPDSKSSAHNFYQILGAPQKSLAE
jgi:hypothetical protein